MNEWLDSIINPLSTGFFINQMLTIVGLFVVGLLVCLNFFVVDNESGAFAIDNSSSGETYKVSDREQNLNGRILRSLLLAYPTGLSLYVLLAYVILVVGIPYNTKGMVVAMLVVVIVNLGDIFKKRKNVNISSRYWLFIGLGIIACVIIAAFSCSGIMSISVSNDSLYYFWKYPKAIAGFEGLRDQFDNFLTDTGLGAAIIGTLPFIFGFGQSFGIQEFFHINFIIIFGYYLYMEIKNSYPEIDNKKACVIVCLSSVLLIVCTPVYILGHWAMANVYFMEFVFIGLFIGKALMQNEFDIKTSNNRSDKISSGTVIFFTLIMFACAQLRMEGGIFILLIVMIISFTKVDGSSLALPLVVIMIVQSAYELKIFTMYTLDYPYPFLTPVKALIQFAAYVGVIVYLLFVRNKINSVIKKKLPIVFMALLIAVNIVLCLMDSEIYIGNLKAFYGNMFGQSGWGMLPYLVIGSIVIILVWEFIVKRRDRFRVINVTDLVAQPVSYWLYSTIAFFLMALAVAFERGDVLYVDTGDSGNRVLLQIAPLVLITFILWFIDLLCYEEKDSEG